MNRFNFTVHAPSQDFVLNCRAKYEAPEPAAGLSGGWFVTEWRYDGLTCWYPRYSFAGVWGAARLEDADQAAMDAAIGEDEAAQIEGSERA